MTQNAFRLLQPICWCKKGRHFGDFFYRCYHSHRSRYSVSPVCGIFLRDFFMISLTEPLLPGLFYNLQQRNYLQCILFLQSVGKRDAGNHIVDTYCRYIQLFQQCTNTGHVAAITLWQSLKANGARWLLLVHCMLRKELKQLLSIYLHNSQRPSSRPPT